jgi:hypothetical protein
VLFSAHFATSVWTGIETSVLLPLKTVWTFYLISLAEDKRFELLKGCPPHAFQFCGAEFVVGQERP